LQRPPAHRRCIGLSPGRATAESLLGARLLRLTVALALSLLPHDYITPLFLSSTEFPHRPAPFQLVEASGLPRRVDGRLPPDAVYAGGLRGPRPHGGR
jgi:hypothetical protein